MTPTRDGERHVGQDAAAASASPTRLLPQLLLLEPHTPAPKDAAAGGGLGASAAGHDARRI